MFLFREGRHLGARRHDVKPRASNFSGCYRFMVHWSSSDSHKIECFDILDHLHLHSIVISGITDQIQGFCDLRKDESGEFEAKSVLLSTTSLSSEWKVGTCEWGR